MHATRFLTVGAPLLAFGLAALACSPTPIDRPVAVDNPPTPTGAIDLRLLHTNDDWGETNPCG
jgi:hypothetical protein